MKYLICIFACTQIWAESLQILPFPPSDKGAGSFQIMITSGEVSSTVALQWLLTTSDNVTIAAKDIHPGAAAQSSKKSLICVAPKDKRSTGHTYTCVLAGGVQTIANGPIAMVRFSAADGTTSATIRLENILGAGTDLKPIRFANVEAKLPMGRVP
jgi:hypothetical protein